MNKNQFQKLIITPLANSLGTKIFFNGQEAWNIGIGYKDRNTKGIAYVWANKAQIVISWQTNFYNTLQALFHELGHTCLHKGNWIIYEPDFIEIEAELMTIQICKYLNIYYNDHSFNYEETDLENLYMHYKGQRKPRYKLINEYAKQIANILKDIHQEYEFSNFK